MKSASPELQSQMFFVFMKGPGFNPEIALNKTVHEPGRSIREIV